MLKASKYGNIFAPGFVFLFALVGCSDDQSNSVSQQSGQRQQSAANEKARYALQECNNIANYDQFAQCQSAAIQFADPAMNMANNTQPPAGMMPGMQPGAGAGVMPAMQPGAGAIPGMMPGMQADAGMMANAQAQAGIQPAGVMPPAEAMSGMQSGAGVMLSAQAQAAMNVAIPAQPPEMMPGAGAMPGMQPNPIGMVNPAASQPAGNVGAANPTPNTASAASDPCSGIMDAYEYMLCARRLWQINNPAQAAGLATIVANPLQQPAMMPGSQQTPPGATMDPMTVAMAGQPVHTPMAYADPMSQQVVANPGMVDVNSGAPYPAGMVQPGSPQPDTFVPGAGMMGQMLNNPDASSADSTADADPAGYDPSAGGMPQNLSTGNGQPIGDPNAANPYGREPQDPVLRDEWIAATSSNDSQRKRNCDVWMKTWSCRRGNIFAGADPDSCLVALDKRICWALRFEQKCRFDESAKDCGQNPTNKDGSKGTCFGVIAPDDTEFEPGYFTRYEYPICITGAPSGN